MKKVFLLTALAIFTVAIYANPNTKPLLQKTGIPGIESSIKAATPFHESLDIVYDFVYSNDCTGEDIHITGKAQLTFHGQINANRVSFSFHFNTQGLKAIGLTTGTNYVWHESDNSTYNGPITNGAFNNTIILRGDIVAPGRGNNYKYSNSFHVTINAKGEVTALSDDFNFECQ